MRETTTTEAPTMQFTLTINLDNAEVADAGIDQVLPEYLRQVAERCETGHADAGTVWDGNGNRIGTYRTEDGS
jgi:hypothetical protein